MGERERDFVAVCLLTRLPTEYNTSILGFCHLCHYPNSFQTTVCLCMWVFGSAWGEPDVEDGWVEARRV